MASNSVACASYSAAVTPSDSLDLPGGLCRAFNLGVSGNVAVMYQSGATDILYGVAAGIPQPYQVKRILSTGTTATSISAIY